jgi:predicted nuclease of predicted toxin-antitoxin system
VNLLADESVDRHIVELLRQNGHFVIYIAEIEPSISDILVFDKANETNSILLTADKDFGEIVFRDDRLVSDGVILIRLAGLSAVKKGEIVLEAIAGNDANLANRFTVISPGRTRFTTRKN